MQVIYLMLYVCAALCFALYSFGVNTTRVNLLGLGVFFWSLVPLLQMVQKI